MVTAYKGIPTDHSGSRFRSRLEARWASFFDSMSWEWEYEPFDMDGYIPDFAIRTKTGPLLVEIKPIVWPQYHGSSAEHIKLATPHAEKALAAGCESIIVLGTAPVHDIALGLGKIGFCDEWYGFAACLCGQPGGWATHCDACDRSESDVRRYSIGMTTTFRLASNRVQWRGL